MARSQARIHSSIWTDDDWKALSRPAKLTYVLLLSQPTLSLAGCLDYMPERWARYDPGTSEEDIADDITELSAAGFIIVDWDTYEVLIRTFAANDLARGALNANLVKGMWAAWSAILSPKLRRAMIDNLPAEVWHKVDQRPAEAEKWRAEPPIQPPPNGDPNRGSDGGSIPGSDGASNHLLSASTSSSASTPADSAPTSPAALSVVPVTLPAPSVPKTQADRLFDEFWTAFPHKKGKIPARRAWDKAIREGADPAAITAGAHAYAVERTYSTAEPKYPQGWLTDGRWNDEPIPPPPGRTTKAAQAGRSLYETAQRMENR